MASKKGTLQCYTNTHLHTNFQSIPMKNGGAGAESRRNSGGAVVFFFFVLFLSHPSLCSFSSSSSTMVTRQPWNSKVRCLLHPSIASVVASRRLHPAVPKERQAASARRGAAATADSSSSAVQCSDSGSEASSGASPWLRRVAHGCK